MTAINCMDETGKEEKKPETIEVGDGESDGDDGEYVVEAICGKRKNPRTGTFEYFIKWEGYSETENTWEPIDNLKCPDLIAKYNEEQKAKRARERPKDMAGPSQGPGRSSRKELSVTPAPVSAEEPLLEESSEDSNEESNEVTGGEKPKSAEPNELVKDVEMKTLEASPRGFGRGHEIDAIIGSSIDSDEKLWFFIKWSNNVSDIEMIASEEVEERAPRDLLAWYKQRLYYTIRLPTEPTSAELKKTVTLS